MATPTPPVWVQLYYKGKDEPKSNPIDIEQSDIPNGNVSGLARRLKEVDMKNDLHHCDRGSLEVYPPVTEPPFLQHQAINPGNDVPSGTTAKTPLIVVAPYPPQQPERDAVQPEVKKAKVELSLQDLEKLANLIPPKLDDRNPKFVAQEDWVEIVAAIISENLPSEDSPDGSHRVSPLAFSRCSRGGKTRALYEIANLGTTYDNAKVPIIFVSFNDFSDIDPEEQKDPLQSLLKRIAFAAWKRRNNPEDGGYTSELYKQFLKKKFEISLDTIVQWLGDGPALLLIDELNNIRALDAEDDETMVLAAQQIGRFLKDYFLKRSGRFFIFSTHVLSSLECLGDFLCPQLASERNVILEQLPIVSNLVEAKQLKQDLMGAREVVFYGLMPGLIHVRASNPRKETMIKRDRAMKRFKDGLSKPEEKVDWFFKILKSLFTGKLEQVPKELHIVLDAAGFQMIRWSPFHLEYVMSTLDLDEKRLDGFAETIAKLCLQLVDSKESSGDGWEAIFVLFLLCRCLTETWDGKLLPAEQFQIFESEKSPVLFFNRPLKKCLDDCKTWEDLKCNISTGSEPQMSVFFPTHARFEVYDVLLVFSENKQIKHTVGYQLKEGKCDSKQPPAGGITSSFVLRGNAPTAEKEKIGWKVVSDEAIDIFFGVTGKYWTPKNWKKLDGN